MNFEYIPDNQQVYRSQQYQQEPVQQRRISNERSVPEPIVFETRPEPIVFETRPEPIDIDINRSHNQRVYVQSQAIAPAPNSYDNSQQVFNSTPNNNLQYQQQFTFKTQEQTLREREYWDQQLERVTRERREMDLPTPHRTPHRQAVSPQPSPMRIDTVQKSHTQIEQTLSPLVVEENKFWEQNQEEIFKGVELDTQQSIVEGLVQENVTEVVVQEIGGEIVEVEQIVSVSQQIEQDLRHSQLRENEMRQLLDQKDAQIAEQEAEKERLGKVISNYINIQDRERKDQDRERKEHQQEKLSILNQLHEHDKAKDEHTQFVDKTLHKTKNMVSGNYLLTFLQFFGLIFIILELRYLMTGNVLSPAQQIKMQYEHYQATHQARAPAAHK